MSKQTTKKIEKLSNIKIGVVHYSKGDMWAFASKEDLDQVINKINELVDHMNKEGKHE
jgi:adenylate kinase family enzyme